MAAPEYLTINELPIGVTGLYEFNFAGGYLEQAHVKLDFVSALGARTNYPLLAGMFVTEFTLQVPPGALPPTAVSVRIYRETPRSEPLISFTNGARLNERNLDRLAAQTIFVAAEAFDAGAFAVAEDLIGQALLAIENANAAQAAADTSALNASNSATSALNSANSAIASRDAAALSASNALASQNAAAASASAALASQNAASSSASAALASQNAAAASADAAGTSQSAAGTSATSAATSATDSANSAAASAASAAAALASENAAELAEANVAATVANVPGRNKIINGKMEIAQRGTSVVPANGAYLLDRWQIIYVTTAGFTLSQQADAPAGGEFQNSMRLAITGADAAIAADDVCYLTQKIEGFNIRDLVGRTFTLSFWVRSSKTGVHCVAFTNNVDRGYPLEYTINAANTWERKTLTVPGGLITAGTWNYTNGVGMNVNFVLANGTTRQAPAGAWAVGDFVSTTNQVNVLDTVDNIFAITGVQLEAGTVATAFEHRPFGQELLLCQRYFQFHAALNLVGYQLATNPFGTTIYLPTTMRGVASATLTSITYLNSSGLSANPTVTSIRPQVTVTSSGVVQVTANLALNAEL